MSTTGAVAWRAERCGYNSQVHHADTDWKNDGQTRVANCHHPSDISWSKTTKSY
ncbi:MAG: hypothetical protein U1C73_15265 [Dietzia sp.]|nr:hypothetical protein [Dietzia sp.]